jgi:hypothetical protein
MGNAGEWDQWKEGEVGKGDNSRRRRNKKKREKDSKN